ncbi:hypothetical protein [Actinotalea solisilvae]|uniref:hypothetical protein n=1 Tax=Actinotalea solisilvae TaxID=2072922 RepID=UPI0018F1BE6D|nr:hypothetical protein [Actinotalea solisilvae]
MTDRTATVRRLRNTRLRLVAVVVAVLALAGAASGAALGEPRLLVVAGMWLASAGLLWWLGGWRPAGPTGGEASGAYGRALGVGVLAAALFFGAVAFLPR